MGWLKPVLIGGGVLGVGGLIAWALSDDEPAKKPAVAGFTGTNTRDGYTSDAYEAEDAVRRLSNFLANARTPGTATIIATTRGSEQVMYLGVIDEGMAPPDIAALPKDVNGIMVRVVSR